MHHFYCVVLFILIISVTSLTVVPCPDVCKCNVMKPSNKSDVGQKVFCSSGLNILIDLKLLLVPNDTVHLILRGNSLSSVPSFSFVNLPHLVKLDLAKNNISEIQEDAFANLTLLERLDLSHNRITNFMPNVFQPLTSLLRLNLQMNFINRLSEGLFNSLTSLKILDLSGNPLICDCHLKWMVDWIRTRKLPLTTKNSCKFPRALEGVSILRVPKKEFHCQWPLELPLFEMYPSVSQLIFEGDSFVLHCHVSNIEHGIEILWMLNDEKLPTIEKKLAINITINSSPDDSLLLSSVHISNVQSLHSGNWKCLVNSSKGSELRSVQLVVISSSGKFCPRISSDDSRGHYIWPETPAGITVELECSGKRASSFSYQSARAYYTCTKSGLWANLNTSFCPYMSEVTNVLEQFSKANFSFTHANVLDSAHLLQNYTSDNRLLKDKMDIVFISQTLQNYMHGVPSNHEIAEVIVDVINTLMSVDKSLLRAAEVEDHACTRLLTILEQLSELLMDAPLNHVTENIAVEDFFVKSEGFPGITCSSFMKNNNVHSSLNSWTENRNKHGGKILNCNIANPEISADELSDAVEASLQLPSTIFQQAGISGLSVPIHKLQFIIYRNSMLFTRSVIDRQVNDITSLIISGKIAHAKVHMLSEPVIVSLRTTAYTNDVKPVWWDAEAFGGRGDWSGNGCSILKVYKNVVTFSCNRLSSFGLLQDVEALLVQYAFERARFQWSHPAIYVGCVFCIAPLTATVMVYCFAYKDLKMPNKVKHSVVNTFLSLMLLCLTFTFGVKQTDIVPVCQGIGFMLHYFTLCSLFWMLVTASNLYKKLVKYDLPESLSNENLPDQPLPPKPMLRFYLVGWGISSIICGISAAVDIDNYGGLKFCFLSLSPSLGALYGPALFLLFLLSCLYLLVYCAIHHKHREVYLVDRVSVQLHDTAAVNDEGIFNEGKGSISEEENIQSYEMQLQNHATVLLLFLLSWLSAYSAVGRPLENYLPHDELLFSLMFCFFSSVLGIYSFVFFCYCRTDAKQYFHTFSSKKSITVECNNVQTDLVINKQTTCVHSNKQDATTSIAFKEVTESAFDSSSLHQSSTHAHSSDHSANNLKVFYDPRQSELARRFFEKNRRQQQMQQTQKNNLEKAVKNKNEIQSYVKYSKASNSSQIIIDYKSESFNDDRSSGSQNSEVLSRKTKYFQSKGERNNMKPLQCVYLQDNACPTFPLNNSQLPVSVHCRSCCSDVSNDIFSKHAKHNKHWKGYQYKCCNSLQQTCCNAKKCEHGTSFSAENLNCHCHCFCQSYTACHKLPDNMHNLRSNSEMSVASCKYLNREREM